MMAVRKIIDGEKLATIMELPGEMKTGQVELIIFPASDSASEKKDDPSLLEGYFKEYANPELAALEKGAWERHTVEKYAHP